MKAANSEKIIATEPAGAALLMGKEWHPHKIQGWTPDFIPDVLNHDVYDDIVPVTDEESRDTSLELARNEGIFVGISAGGTLAAAIFTLWPLARVEEVRAATLFRDGNLSRGARPRWFWIAVTAGLFASLVIAAATLSGLWQLTLGAAGGLLGAFAGHRQLRFDGLDAVRQFFQARAVKTDMFTDLVQRLLCAEQFLLLLLA